MIAIILYFIHPAYGFVAAAYFILVGVIVPYVSSILVKTAGVNYRQAFASSNQYILDSLRGLKEILLFNQGTRAFSCLK